MGGEGGYVKILRNIYSIEKWSWVWKHYKSERKVRYIESTGTTVKNHSGVQTEQYQIFSKTVVTVCNTVNYLPDFHYRRIHLRNLC